MSDETERDPNRDRNLWRLFAVVVLAVCIILMSLSKPSYTTPPRPGCVFEGAREIECGASHCLVCFGDEKSLGCYRFNHNSCNDIEER